MPDPSKDDITPNFTLSWDYPGYVLLTTAKYLDMVVKGVKDPADKSVLVVHKPPKGRFAHLEGPGAAGEEMEGRPRTLDEREHPDRKGAAGFQTARVVCIASRRSTGGMAMSFIAMRMIARSDMAANNSAMPP